MEKITNYYIELKQLYQLNKAEWATPKLVHLHGLSVSPLSTMLRVGRPLPILHCHLHSPLAAADPLSWCSPFTKYLNSQFLPSAWGGHLHVFVTYGMGHPCALLILGWLLALSITACHCTLSPLSQAGAAAAVFAWNFPVFEGIAQQVGWLYGILLLFMKVRAKSCESENM